jgi:hypothetical protein
MSIVLDLILSEGERERGREGERERGREGERERGREGPLSCRQQKSHQYRYEGKQTATLKLN